MNRTAVTHLLAGLFMVSLLPGCESRQVDPGNPPAIRTEDGSLAIRVVLPEKPGAGLTLAADDLKESLVRITGAVAPDDFVIHDTTTITNGRPVINVLVVPGADEELGDQGYWLDFGLLGGGSPALTVTARTETAAMYGIYRIIGDLGVRYFHPEETFFPADPEATLPWNYPDVMHVPHFTMRGFHEHTQHPIPASEFLLRPQGEDSRILASNYLKWLARNRQNVLTFHMLKTVDLDTWLPVIGDIVDEAHSYGIEVGLLVGFVDQQQNAFRLIREDDVDPSTGAMKAADGQIDERLDRLLVAGFDIVGLQIGSSEFTKPDETEAVGWMNHVVEHLRTHHPGVRAYAWIHITCDLESDDGGLYFHVPLETDVDLGAYVHTTMFYTLEHPAPAYGCEVFSHQKDFLSAATEQRRRQVFFPESAWWLGFDINLPLALPLTGWSREWDIREVLPQYTVAPTDDDPGYRVEGHATFTTGREWTYWQYDHFLTRITWDRDVNWDGYLDWIGPLYGEEGAKVAQALKDWTLLQKKHIYDMNPHVYLYLAGELPQDEAGFLAGIISREVRPAFRHVCQMDDPTFSGWKKDDYDLLAVMEGEYQAVLDTLSASLASGTDQQKALYAEMHDVLYIYIRRIEHALALYAGVIAAREKDEEAATAHLETARAVTAEMKDLFVAAEDRYRYPVDLVARPLPEGLTAYKFGYLAETSSAYFWSRRDDQLAVLLADVFDSTVEAWVTPPDALYRADPANVTLVEPDDPMVAGFLPPFVPAMLFGTLGMTGAFPAVILAQDYDLSGLPDPGTELKVDVQATAGGWDGSAPSYDITVRDVTGKNLGAFSIVDLALHLDSDFSGASLKGGFSTDDLIEVIVNVTEGGIDAEGVTNIIKEVFGVSPDDPLPPTLPIHFNFVIEKI